MMISLLDSVSLTLSLSACFAYNNLTVESVPHWSVIYIIMKKERKKSALDFTVSYHIMNYEVNC